MSRFYITTPIYYVNDLPHIGHMYTTIVADVIARYRRLMGDEVYFVTGTDEHGQKIERAAAAGGVRPIELADRVVSHYHDVWKQLEISHDDFIRTSEARHHRGVEEIVRRIAAADDFYVDRHEGWYCASCETFYTEKELLEGQLCPDHQVPAEWQSEENVFFRLSKYQDRLLELYASRPEIVRPQSRLNEVRAFVESGLRDLSVSRTQVSWGIPFPQHEGHLVYVWLDALTNYISALGFGVDGGELYSRFWDDDDAVRVHLIGKDIIRFHCVYWPAFLMAAGLPLPSTILAHGWWLVDESKISKSVGRVVRPDHLIDRFGADSLRYYLLRDMVFGQDASFSDEAFVDRYNADLANGLGNTVSRLTTLSSRAFDGCTPPARVEGPLAAAAATAIADYRRHMDGFAPHRALEAIGKLVDETNQYLVAHEPWKLMKQPEELGRVGEILWSGMEAMRLAAIALSPVIPGKATAVLRAIGADIDLTADALSWGRLGTGVPLSGEGALFPRIDKKTYLAEITSEPKEEDSMIDISTFAQVDLRVATVMAAEEIPKSSKLVKLTVELGDETRTVVAGIRKQYAPEELVGRQVVIVANLQPVMLMGVQSQGMVLAASDEGAAVLLEPEQQVPNGTRVR